MPSFRNARFINEDRNRIDMDLEHPTEGWIPITIVPSEYPELWQEVVASRPSFDQRVVDRMNARDLETWRASAGLQRGPFCIAMRQLGIWAQQEAVAASRGEWTQTLDAAIHNNATIIDPDNAPVLWAGMSTIYRASWVVELLRQQGGVTALQMDEPFRAVGRGNGP